MFFSISQPILIRKEIKKKRRKYYCTSGVLKSKKRRRVALGRLELPTLGL
jgi:hypothetical protein